MAAYGPKALTLAGKCGDGVIFQVADPYFIEWGMQWVRKGAEEAGRDISEITATARRPPTSRPTRTRRATSTRWFPALVGNHIAEVLHHHKAENLPPALDEYIQARTQYDYLQHGHPGADHSKYVPDEITDRFCVNGTEEQIEAKLRELAALGVSEFNIYPYIPNLLERSTSTAVHRAQGQRPHLRVKDVQTMKVKCALIQMNFSTDVAENVAQAAGYVREAGRNGAKIICLPELTTTQYFCIGMNREFMESPSRSAVRREGDRSRRARRRRLGRLPVLRKVQEGELYNSAAFLDRNGESVGLYRKNMIPLVNVYGIEGTRSSTSGPETSAIPCWDRSGRQGRRHDLLRPALPRGAALPRPDGADVIFVPTATPLGGEMWEIELRGHAVANLYWVGAANRVGKDRDGFSLEFYGVPCGARRTARSSPPRAPRRRDRLLRDRHRPQQAPARGVGLLPGSPPRGVHRGHGPLGDQPESGGPRGDRHRCL